MNLDPLLVWQVRVDSTTSAVLRQLAVRGAEMTDKLPPRSIELLESINASGRYFEFYAARNYFDRGYDHDKTALHALQAGGASTTSAAIDDKYVVPAYELRRALALARGRAESFRLAYTRLPPALTTPTEWRAYEGEYVVVDETGRCDVHTPGLLSLFTTSACEPTELALLPPPSRLLRKLLLPYPTPLLEGAGDGQHCTT